MDDKVVGTIWIRTEMRDDESGYFVTLVVDEDAAYALTPAHAMAHAYGVLTAVARAEYDAAVINQMAALNGIAIDAALRVVKDMRADRPPLDPDLTAPLSFEACIKDDYKPFLVLLVDGKRVGQWDMEDARSHALAVIEAVAVADLDSVYLRTLVSTIGLDKTRARHVIDDLANYRLLTEEI